MARSALRSGPRTDSEAQDVQSAGELHPCDSGASQDREYELGGRAAWANSHPHWAYPVELRVLLNYHRRVR